MLAMDLKSKMYAAYVQKPRASMIKYPSVLMTPKANTEPNRPTFKKSLVVTYVDPVPSSNAMAFMFGNPLTGKPIAPEHIKAAPMTSSFG